MCNLNIHPIQLESTSKSSYNSLQVGEEAVHVVLAKRELDGTHTNLSMEESSQKYGGMGKEYNLSSQENVISSLQ